MDSSASIAADVLIGPEMSTADEYDVLEAFATIDVAATTRLAPTQRSLDGIEWLVLAVLPLQAFLSSLGSKLAEDVYGGLKDVVGRILRRSSPERRARTLVLQDTATGLQVVLESDLPIEAYRQLVALDLSTVHGGPIRYDRSHNTWQPNPTGEPRDLADESAW
jgi:hypothetical protein